MDANNVLVRNTAPFSSWTNKTKTITPANTLVQLQTTHQVCRMLRLKAPITNAGTIHIGSSIMTTSNSALTLLAGDEVNIAINDPFNVWIIATTNNDKVNYLVIP